MFLTRPSTVRSDEEVLCVSRDFFCLAFFRCSGYRRRRLFREWLNQFAPRFRGRRHGNRLALRNSRLQAGRNPFGHCFYELMTGWQRRIDALAHKVSNSSRRGRASAMVCVRRWRIASLSGRMPCRVDKSTSLSSILSSGMS